MPNIEVTLHSVCEVKEFGQVTVEKGYKHTSYMIKRNFVLQELSLQISVVTSMHFCFFLFVIYKL